MFIEFKIIQSLKFAKKKTIFLGNLVFLGVFTRLKICNLKCRSSHVGNNHAKKTPNFSCKFIQAFFTFLTKLFIQVYSSIFAFLTKLFIQIYSSVFFIFGFELKFYSHQCRHVKNYY